MGVAPSFASGPPRFKQLAEGGAISYGATTTRGMPTSRLSKAKAVRPGDRAPKGLLLSPQAAHWASGVEIVRWSPSASTPTKLLSTEKAPWLSRCQGRELLKVSR